MDASKRMVLVKAMKAARAAKAGASSPLLLTQTSHQPCPYRHQLLPKPH